LGFVFQAEPGWAVLAQVRDTRNPSAEGGVAIARNLKSALLVSPV